MDLWTDAYKCRVFPLVVLQFSEFLEHLKQAMLVTTVLSVFKNFRRSLSVLFRRLARPRVSLFAMYCQWNAYSEARLYRRMVWVV